MRFTHIWATHSHNNMALDLSYDTLFLYFCLVGTQHRHVQTVSRGQTEWEDGLLVRLWKQD